MVQRENSNLQSAIDTEKGTVVSTNQRISTIQSDLQTAQFSLVAEKGTVVKANQTISTLRSDLETARAGAETLMANYDTQVTRFQRDKSNLQSALDAEKGVVVKLNQTISTLQSELQTAQVGTETLKDHGAKVIRFSAATLICGLLSMLRKGLLSKQIRQSRTSNLI
ncbi:hypothetical protein OG21DRAFT_422599 [Imleria badia]|nr:hypothetical protein OG21DRAFT_422599 [Imleria badia]